MLILRSLMATDRQVHLLKAMPVSVGVGRAGRLPPAPTPVAPTAIAPTILPIATTAFAVVPAQVIPNVHLDITVMKEYAKKHRKQLWYMR